MFLHPEYSVSPAIASRQASEFFGAKAVLDFMADYSKLVCSTLSASGKEVEEPPRPKVQEPKTVIEKNKGETDAEYKKRRKRESVELVVDKIIDHIDEADDFDSILDTIKAMERTGFFESELLAEKPPMRYLPVTCGECEYKQFIDEQIKIGNIEKI